MYQDRITQLCPISEKLFAVYSDPDTGKVNVNPIVAVALVENFCYGHTDETRTTFMNFVDRCPDGYLDLIDTLNFVGVAKSLEVTKDE